MKSLLDILIFIAFYFAFFYPKWQKFSRSSFFAKTIFYVYLVAVFYFTLMPVVASLPFIFGHPYVPMNLEPFIDVALSRGDFLNQIILNIVMTIPFGFLFPLTKASPNTSVKPALKASVPTFLKTVSYVFLLSLTIELLQPLISSSRRSDITDIITNLLGGVIGYILYILCRPLLNKIISALGSNRS